MIVNDYKNAKQNYNSEHASILPRMWSSEHAENYMMFSGFLDFKVKLGIQNSFYQRAINAGASEEQANTFALNQVVKYKKEITDFKNQVAQGNVDYEDYSNFLKKEQSNIDIEKPSLGHNIAYMLEYQLGYMYWRYFMWNFSGRQDDIQGRYDNHGNWISGIKSLDEWHLGYSQDNLPSDVKNNKARNTYYLLPLILGILGFFFLFNTDKKLFWTMLVFFLFTGLAIQFYTNVRPFEPRERDYSVVGSFYVFALWIGFGVYALFDFGKKYLPEKLTAPIITVLCLVLVPGILAANNWDDHDRSDKHTAKAMARMYLDSCAENAILFTIGDNDTFALWYAQEIEGYRTDVRVINTSLFQTDWYIDQMKRKAYESDPIPSQLTHDDYKLGTNEYVRTLSITKDTLDIKEALKFITSSNPKTRFKYYLQQFTDADISQYPRRELNARYLPTDLLRIPVNKENALKSRIVTPKDKDKIVPYIDIKIKDGAIYKNRLLMLDIVANNEWNRPIYFTGGAFSDDDYIWMKDYLQLDGMCYKLVPIITPVDRANPFDMGRVDSELMYEKVKNWYWGNSGSPDIYHDVETRKNSITYRGNLARLIETLINEEKLDKAEEIADIAMTNMPVEYFGYYTLLEPYISAYYEVENKEKAQQLFKEVANKYQENLSYYSGLKVDKQERLFEDIYTDIQRYKGLVDVLIEYDVEFAEIEGDIFNNYLKLFKHFYGGETDEDEFIPKTDQDIPTTIDSAIEVID